jgi:mRNA interferase RelE/StbE
MGMIKLTWFKEAVIDFKNLDGSQKIRVKKGIDKIQEQGFEIGKPLVGRLIGTREIKIKKDGLRIIFKKSSVNQDEIEIIDIIVIGKRSDQEVFDEATRRIDNH